MSNYIVPSDRSLREIRVALQGLDRRLKLIEEDAAAAAGATLDLRQDISARLDDFSLGAVEDETGVSLEDESNGALMAEGTLESWLDALASSSLAGALIDESDADIADEEGYSLTEEFSTVSTPQTPDEYEVEWPIV